MTLSRKIRRGLPRVITFACGILGFILFRWTPATATGLLVYLALFAVVVVLLIFLPTPKRGYWLGKAENHGSSVATDPNDNAIR